MSWGKQKHTKYGHFLQIASGLAIFSDHKITSPPHELIYSSFLRYFLVDWAEQFRFSWVKCAWHMIVTSMLCIYLPLRGHLVCTHKLQYMELYMAADLCFIAILCIGFTWCQWSNQQVMDKLICLATNHNTIQQRPNRRGPSQYNDVDCLQKMSTKLCMK